MKSSRTKSFGIAWLVAIVFCAAAVLYKWPDLIGIGEEAVPTDRSRLHLEGYSVATSHRREKRRNDDGSIELLTAMTALLGPFAKDSPASVGDDRDSAALDAGTAEPQFPFEVVETSGVLENDLPVFHLDRDPESQRADEPPASAPDTAEDQAIAGLDPPEVRAWRERFRQEAKDETWTRRTEAELLRHAEETLGRGVNIEILDCRRTLCRMMLNFDTEHEAQAFRSAIQEDRQSGLEYSYKDMDPGREGDVEESGVTYEILAHRTEGY